MYMHTYIEAHTCICSNAYLIKVPGRLYYTSAYVSIRQHTSAYVSIRQHIPNKGARARLYVEIVGCLVVGKVVLLWGRSVSICTLVPLKASKAST
jgi:hypothetical protein